MTDPINQEHEEVLNFAHSLPSGLTKEQIYVRIHERARAIPPAAAAAGLPAELTDAQIEEIAEHAYRNTDKLNCWSGFRKDSDGKYTVPDLMPQHLQLCRVMLAAAPALPADPVDESQPADERAKFDAWWSEFTDEHDDWCYADSSALRWAAFKAGAALSAPVAPVTPKAIEEITDILLWPVTEDDARTARDMLQSIHFDLSMAENVAPVPAAQEGALSLADGAANCIRTGINYAASHIEKQAKGYMLEHSSMDPDTGAVSWHYGEAGREYHSTLVELAEEIRALAAPAMEAQSHE